jgi:gentisate 1,2-dioxygenase
MAISDVGTTTEDLERYLAGHHLVGAGLRRDGQAPPRKGNTAAYWSWKGIHDGLQQSGRIVTVGPGGMTGMRSVTGIEARTFPIWLNVQILMPGERTQAHRVMRSETRLVVEAPRDAVFVCEYEAFPMERGDVVITPPWTFHDHFNQGPTPAIFVDGYDDGHNPGAVINERLPDDAPYQQITRPEGFALKTLGYARRPSDEPPFPLPPMHYRWRETEAALAALRDAEVEPDPYDGQLLTLASPVDGGPTLPTIAWNVQVLSPHQKTLAHRHNSVGFYHVFEGSGATVIEGERLEWTKGDLFAVPFWKWHYHENAEGSDTILFSIDDWPAMKKLGFYRKEEALR